MKAIRILALLAGLGSCALGAAHADALATLNDADALKRAQADIAQMPHADLDALNDTVATCAAVSLGQRPQQFECERAVYRWWTRYNRGRAVDEYLAAIGTLFNGFDNNASNPPPALLEAYKKTSVGMVSLANAINQRYRQLEK